MILNESLRAVSSATHGYEKDTTPMQTKFLKENDGIIFNNFYAVSSRTILAIPSLLTGINPVQPGANIFKYPIISNYAKQFSNVNTFVISSHPYNWGNYLKFLDDGSWDYLYYQEISNIPQKSEYGIDDKYVTKTFDDYIAKLETNFIGIAHLYGTHQPYASDETDRKYEQDDPVGKYDNSVITLDRRVGEIIASLKKYNLLSNTIIVSTADHAEALGEHGYQGHLHTFFEEEAKVPAWLFIPKELREDERFNEKYLRAVKNKDKNLSNVDIIPTILDLAGLWDSPNVTELKKLFLGNPVTKDIDPLRVINFQNYNDVSKKNLFVGMGLKYKNYKYMLHTKYGKLVEEVYDLESDPKEKQNIISDIDGELLAFFHDELKKHKNSNILYRQMLKQNQSKR